MVSTSGLQSCGVYTEDWERILRQLESFLCVRSEFCKSLCDVDVRRGYTVASIFDSGDGRVYEMIGKWLLRLVPDTRVLLEKLDSEEQSDEKALVEKCGEFFPKSVNQDLLIVHMIWDLLQKWTKGREHLDYLGISPFACTGQG